MDKYDFIDDEEGQLGVRSWEYVVGPDDQENMGQIVVVTMTKPGYAQKESITRLTVQMGIIVCYLS